MRLGLVTQLCLTLATPWTIACQPPLSMGFSRQEYWSGLPTSNIWSWFLYVRMYSHKSQKGWYFFGNNDQTQFKTREQIIKPLRIQPWHWTRTTAPTGRTHLQSSLCTEGDYWSVDLTGSQAQGSVVSKSGQWVHEMILKKTETGENSVKHFTPGPHKSQKEGLM